MIYEFPSYFTMLTAEAERVGVDLIDAFVRAGVNTSVYYRSRQGWQSAHASQRRPCSPCAR